MQKCIYYTQIYPMWPRRILCRTKTSKRSNDDCLHTQRCFRDNKYEDYRKQKCKLYSNRGGKSIKHHLRLWKPLHNTDLGIWIGLLFGPRNSSFLLSCSLLFQNSTAPWKSVPLQISNINMKEGDFFSFQKKPFWELSFSSRPARSVASHVISVTCRRTCFKPPKVTLTQRSDVCYQATVPWR